MRDFLVLRIIDKSKFIYDKLGVDYKQVRLILQSKLVMDSRKNTNFKGSTNEGNAFYISLIIYSLFGLFASLIMRVPIDGFVRMTLYFTFIMSVIFMAFISEFSSVLLDIKDKNILSTKGIDSKTLNVAKITHILIYIVMLSFSICGFGIIVAFKFGPTFLILFLLSIILIDLFMIVFTSLLYSVVIQMFKGEKLKDMINILQIGIVVVFIVVYQIIGQSIDLNNVNVVFESKLWNILVPPMWFAANFKVALSSYVTNLDIAMSVLSILVPIICFTVYIKNISKFENNLNKLNDHTYKASRKNIPTVVKISKAICKNKEERAFFNFSYNIISKDRELKMRIYPSLAMGLLLPYMLMFTVRENLSLEFATMSIYMSMVIIVGILAILKYSENYKSAWIYDIVPIKNTSSIFKGLIKAITYKIYIPMFLIFSIGLILIFKIAIIKHLVAIILGLILSTILIVRMERSIPFSNSYSVATMSSNIGKLFVYIFIIGVIAISHFSVIKNTLLLYGYMVVLIVLITIAWNKLLNIDIN